VWFSVWHRNSGLWLRINGFLPVFPDGIDQRCNDPLRIQQRLALLRPLNLVPQALFFSLVKANELNARPVPERVLLTPYENATLLPVDAIFEPDNAGLDRPFGLDPDTGCAEIYYPGAVISPLKVLKCDDSEGAVTLHGEGIPSQPFSLIVSCISHEENAVPAYRDAFR
jgi:hypothetical protein